MQIQRSIICTIVLYYIILYYNYENNNHVSIIFFTFGCKIYLIYAYNYSLKI